MTKAIVVEGVDDDIVIEVPKPTAKEKSIPSNPVEDRFGRGRWVRTRLCYCLPDSRSPCQMVKRESCPSEKLDKSQRTNGEWLWATNPELNKPMEKIDE